MAPIYLFVTPSYNPRPGLTTRQKLAGLDWVGVVLNTAVWVILLTTIAFSGSTFAWDSAANITLWVVWGVVLVAFYLQQRFSVLTVPTKRLWPVRFLQSRDMVLLSIATACSATANAVTLYYLALFFVFTRGDSALDAAVRLLPFIVVFITCVMVSGATLPLAHRYSPYYLVSGVLVTAGSAAMSTIRADTSTGVVYGCEVLIAAGSASVEVMPPEAARLAVETIAYTIARLFGMNVAAGALLLVVAVAMKHEKIDLAAVVGG